MLRQIIFSSILLIVFTNCISKEKKRILFISTNIDVVNDKPNGTYLTEIAVPFKFFLDKGYDIDIVSPKGGAIPTYYKFELKADVIATKESEIFKQKTGNSLSPDKVNYNDYDAVIIPGGYGQFWDVHSNKEIQKIIANIHESGGAIGTVGHGTAALINVKLASEEYLVKGKKLVCFPTWNEKNIMNDSNYGKLLPYDMEQKLTENGADLRVYNRQKRENYEIVDVENRIVSASFSTGGKYVSEKVYELIKK